MKVLSWLPYPLLKLFDLYVSFRVRTSVYHTLAVPTGASKGVGSPGTGVEVGCELSCGS